MEGSVSVNAEPRTNGPSGDGAEASPVYRTIDIHPTRGFPIDQPASAANTADFGPCLYLGPAGERCDARAIEGGYCAKHTPGATPPIRAYSKVLAASGAIIAVIWPYLADLVREIIRLMRSQ
jgi:hypothetical protein